MSSGTLLVNRTCISSGILGGALQYGVENSAGICRKFLQQIWIRWTRLEWDHRRGGSCPLTIPLSASADWAHQIAKRAFDSGSKSGGRKSRFSARFVPASNHSWRGSSYPVAFIKFLEDSTRSGAVVPWRKLGVCVVDGTHSDFRYRWRWRWWLWRTGLRRTHEVANV